MAPSSPASEPPFDLSRLELHGTGIGLVPEPGSAAGAVWIEAVPDIEGTLRHCSCPTAKERTCDHLRELSVGVTTFRERHGKRSWEKVFAGTLWYHLAALLVEGDARPATSPVVEVRDGEGPGGVRLVDGEGRELVRWAEASPARWRLLERLGQVLEEGPFRNRAAVLERLARLQRTRQERQLEKAGVKSRGQTREESLWYRVAYHCARELGDAVRFHPRVDRDTGAFTLACHREEGGAEGDEVLRLSVPRGSVERVLELLGRWFPGQEDLALEPVPLRTLFHVTAATDIEGDAVDVRPVLETLQADGETRYLEREELERFRYGRLLYVPELEVLAELEEPGRERRFRAPRRLRLARSQVPGFLEAHRDEIEAGWVVFGGELAGVRIFRHPDAVELARGEPEAWGEEELAEASARSWYWLSVSYRFGGTTVPLVDLLEARRRGLPFLEVEGGWVDLDTPAVREAEGLVAPPRRGDGTAAPSRLPDSVRLGVAELLRLGRVGDLSVEVVGDGPEAELLGRLLELRPATPFEPPEGLASPLRPYQLAGVEWLRFLAENRLSGLLCDDMGLGKTHQAMALMASLREREESGEPFLVVCPTSVLPHWAGKLAAHAPGLTAAVHHGPQRDVTEALDGADVVLTSYGVLRNDVEALAGVGWALVVFDEIQHLKNPATASHRSAARLAARMRLGLTGTPVENSVAELKALFDLVLPGYLGSDESFLERYGDAGPESEAGRERLGELSRLLSPFVLRRTKSAVLDELPEKFEDLRWCTLSEEQVELYRKLVGERGGEIVERLRSGLEPVPYIHVFALLNHLKRICDHPALALDELDRAGEHHSGKWELFSEILDEALGSGQKVVVFTQYLGMITLMERLLESRGVGYATLTGASTRRGEIVDRFNHDPGCRVFLGSLKAGGTGIDLIGGSVVIHYDRWWNAAREDQATDRVHRIGQHRAVQVVKLLTEGTLEEKIHAIIEGKRRLAGTVVEEDSPHLAKVFSREELLDLLEPV